VVLLSGDGHYWVALDYRGSIAEPPVTLFDNDFGTEVVLAPDFRSFVEGLGQPNPLTVINRVRRHA
jgi:hypothetical protein